MFDLSLAGPDQWRQKNADYEQVHGYFSYFVQFAVRLDLRRFLDDLRELENSPKRNELPSARHFKDQAKLRERLRMLDQSPRVTLKSIRERGFSLREFSPTLFDAFVRCDEPVKLLQMKDILDLFLYADVMGERLLEDSPGGVTEYERQDPEEPLMPRGCFLLTVDGAVSNEMLRRYLQRVLMKIDQLPVGESTREPRLSLFNTTAKQQRRMKFARSKTGEQRASRFALDAWKVYRTLQIIDIRLQGDALGVTLSPQDISARVDLDDDTFKRTAQNLADKMLVRDGRLLRELQVLAIEEFNGELCKGLYVDDMKWIWREAMIWRRMNLNLSRHGVKVEPKFRHRPQISPEMAMVDLHNMLMFNLMDELRAIKEPCQQPGVGDV